MIFVNSEMGYISVGSDRYKVKALAWHGHLNDGSVLGVLPVEGVGKTVAHTVYGDLSAGEK